MSAKPYYTIVPCCSSSGTATPSLFFNFDLAGGYPTTGTHVYTGSTVTINGITFTDGYCYTITSIGISLNDFPEAPLSTFFDSTVDGCTDPGCYDCESPPTPVSKCFKLYSCDGDIIISDSTLNAYVNTLVSLVGESGCYYVTYAPESECSGPDVVDVTVDPDVPCTCDCKCYQVTGNPTSIFYVDCDLVSHTVSGTSKFCSIIPPVVIGGLTGNIVDFGLCVNGECPDICFEFLNCATGQVLIVSNTSQIAQYYANNSVVTLLGYEGCWTIDIAETCECPVNVTILQVHPDCPTCLPVIAYKFTSCNNSAIIQYTLDDYSQYVGKTVVLDCGGCWNVTQIDYMPPATQTISVLFTYDNCIDCNTIYYKLTDCNFLGNVVYTGTDLSAYLDKIVTLENCEGCYSIEVTQIPVNPGAVTVVDSFDLCQDCNATTPCICTTVKNYDTIPHVYNYIDCEGNPQTFTVDPGDTSDKVCMRGFIGDEACNCIELTINGEAVTAILQPNEINGKPYWTFTYNTYLYTLSYNIVSGWQITSTLVPNGGLVAQLDNPLVECPDGDWTIISNPTIDISVYFDNGTFQFGGVLVYDYNQLAYFGSITYLGNTYQFALNSVYFQECTGTWNLSYYNTDHTPPMWTPVASWPADCNCLNGTYTDITPSFIYIEVNALCEINTVNCSEGYEPFIPAATDDIKEYGECLVTDNPLKPFTCPTPVYPKRPIIPGYSVPSCDVEKYEKYSCNAAEILYKTVLEKRYGISNCCPDMEADERWIIKKELADLQGATDPNYVCTPVETCCDNAPTCGCITNTTPRTCNSG